MAVITKILIANRGEIALRIHATCKDMGIVTVGVFAEDDRNLPHATELDETFSLGTGTLQETYLNQQKILTLAKECGAQAIHPGYGFLSENASFAQAVEKAGLIFVGPKSQTIALMGDKIASKKTIEEMKGPLLPGYHGDQQTADFLFKQAQKIGMPLLIKASSGGGGKGMRLVEKEEYFLTALEEAKREAKNAFGNDSVFLEKYLSKPRHIEVQVFSDSHGNHVHLFERDCSIQRRYQKIIEEAPAVGLPLDVREKITTTAVAICKHIGYLGAGTIEFMMDADFKFYFLEMNTRLQVEHPVTEMVTGIDLVQWQIRVAMGEEIPCSQKDITLRGHALECRLYAEDPFNDNLPTGGKILKWKLPFHRDYRLDRGYAEGNTVTLNYDPMVAKIIVRGENRTQALARMQETLKDLYLVGFKTNREYLRKILNLKEFKKGDVHTAFLKEHADKIKMSTLTPEQESLVLTKTKKSSSENQVKEKDLWSELTTFRNV